MSQSAASQVGLEVEACSEESVHTFTFTLSLSCFHFHTFTFMFSCFHAPQVGLEVEVGSVESVLAATVVEIERNQGRIANPGPKVRNIFGEMYFFSSLIKFSVKVFEMYIVLLLSKPAVRIFSTKFLKTIYC